MDLEARIVGILSEKDKESRVIKCNDAFVHYAGVDSRDEILGNTDYDFPWAEFADIYRKHELDALSGNNYSILFPLKKHDGDLILFLHKKMQKLDQDGNPSGVICHATEITDVRVYDLYNDFKKDLPKACEKIVLGKTYEKFQLSRRQLEILFYTIRGKSAKQIAAYLGLSVRTIEYHIEHLKTKFNCGTKCELIAYAMENGFSELIPKKMNMQDLMKKLK
ncbi:MAG: LuxR C-terminal-related transcriptional regulator [Gammaproteobacteria bacterium]